MIIPDRKTVSVIKATMHPDGTSTNDDMEGGDTEALAQDLLHAIETKDAMGVSDAFKALFLAFESEPHDEMGEQE